DLNLIRSLIAGASCSQCVKIKNIKSKQARNYLRGVDSTNYNKVSKALKKIKLNCSYVDYKKAVDFVRENNNYEDNRIGRLFNKQIPKGLFDDVEYTFGEILKKIDA
ncbi:hypothetical protein, partial [Klebsiella variicola]|uniref:hypothetical protein n=1 Tax=Klebsiella variicola TaxID=244366 RepID=UPI002B055EF9